MGITAFIILIIQNSREDIREKENGRKLISLSWKNIWFTHIEHKIKKSLLHSSHFNESWKDYLTGSQPLYRIKITIPL